MDDICVDGEEHDLRYSGQFTGGSLYYCAKPGCAKVEFLYEDCQNGG